MSWAPVTAGWFSVSVPSQARIQEPAHRRMTMTGKRLEPDGERLGELMRLAWKNEAAQV